MTGMRIAFYSPRASHLESIVARGGDPVFLNALFGGLRDRGHDVRVISRMDIRDVRDLRLPSRRIVAEALAIRSETKLFSPDGWIVYNPSRTYPDLFGWWQRPKRYILLAAHTWQSERVPKRWRWLFDFAYRRSLKRADWVTATRPGTAARLQRRGVSADRLSVLPPAVAAPANVPSQQEARRRLGLPEDQPLALCVTRFTEPGSKARKTEIVFQLLEAVARLGDKPLLVIVGDGPGRPVIEKRASEIRPDDRVRLFSAVPNEELVWFYAACGVYAYPDTVDLPRLSVIEAQACGRPVLVMRTPSAELIVVDGRTGILVDEIADFGRELAVLIGDRSDAS